MILQTDTICALITPPGRGAIGVIRISGTKTFEIISKIFMPARKNISTSEFEHQHIYFGKIVDQKDIIDEVLVSIFKAPATYTGEDVAELSCHGSGYIRQRILQLIMQSGAVMARPGEFTMRAYLNGKMDLAQAEAVADIIAAENSISHHAAMQQMRGGYSDEIKSLRDQLVKFAALIELELDFSEEDVEFASRDELKALVLSVKHKIKHLLKSYELGNILKNGVPVVIAGKPNVGKSTLLNSLLNEERAIVSDIAGTTRDTIEEELNVDGIRFRFIDTAGIRKTDDAVESIGVKRTYAKASEAKIILYLFDPMESSPADLQNEISQLQFELELSGKDMKKIFLLIANKSDTLNSNFDLHSYDKCGEVILISAKHKSNLNLLKETLIALSGIDGVALNESVVTNARHAVSLTQAGYALDLFLKGVEDGISNDLLSTHIRDAIYALGEITGQVSTEDLLDYIFSQFCIGK